MDKNTENQTDNVTEITSKYSKEQLEIVEAFNRVANAKTMNDATMDYQKQVRALDMANHSNLTKISQLQLQAMRESLRPHRMYHCDIAYSPEEGQYVCRMSGMLELEDEGEGEIPIAAYGDTPAQACDNFDHMWVQSVKGS